MSIITVVVYDGTKFLLSLLWSYYRKFPVRCLSDSFSLRYTFPNNYLSTLRVTVTKLSPKRLRPSVWMNLFVCSFVRLNQHL